jgi:hypothetical protein
MVATVHGMMLRHASAWSQLCRNVPLQPLNSVAMKNVSATVWLWRRTVATMHWLTIFFRASHYNPFFSSCIGSNGFVLLLGAPNGS